jgi:hypothetical protein
MNATTVIELLKALATALGGVAGGPIGAGTVALVTTVLSLAADLIAKGKAGAAELSALNDQIKAMVAENRGPTDAEWTALRAQSDAAHKAIQNAPPRKP